MKIIKTKLHNKINNGWFNHLIVCYTEKRDIDDVTIMRKFQGIKTRKMNLPRVVN